MPESGIGIFGDLFKLLLTPQEDLDEMINGVSVVISRKGKNSGQFSTK